MPRNGILNTIEWFNSHFKPHALLLSAELNHLIVRHTVQNGITKHVIQIAISGHVV
jgi:hypothetical protein